MNSLKSALEALHSGVASIPSWMSLHPIRTDLIIAAVVLSLVVYLLGRQKAVKRRLLRIRRGVLMRGAPLTLRQRMRIEDAILDACLDMQVNGEMTDQQHAEWCWLFATKMGMTDMLPRKSPFFIKRAISKRLERLSIEIDRIKKYPRWWGSLPTVAVDTSYNPHVEEVVHTSRDSKFAVKT